MKKIISNIILTAVLVVCFLYGMYLSRKEDVYCPRCDAFIKRTDNMEILYWWKPANCYECNYEFPRDYITISGLTIYSRLLKDSVEADRKHYKEDY